jgi:hypothetical protein
VAFGGEAPPTGRSGIAGLDGGNQKIWICFRGHGRLPLDGEICFRRLSNHHLHREEPQKDSDRPQAQPHGTSFHGTISPFVEY